MVHVAIMRKSWNLTQKILTGEKKIESRWYKTKHIPWGRISAGDIIYFKDSGYPVRIKAIVEKVMQFENLTSQQVSDILDTYGTTDGIGIEDISIYKEMFKDRTYCILVFLKNAEEVQPFDINKKGFGNMAAWISVDDIEKIKITK